MEKMELTHQEGKLNYYFKGIKHNIDYLEEVCYKKDIEKIINTRQELQEQYKHLKNYLSEYLIEEE